MDMVNQYEIYWVELNPTIGSEINKIRPCVVISPNSTNAWLNTVLVAPLTSTIRQFPMRLDINLQGNFSQICLDQIRCVDKQRLRKKLENLHFNKIIELENLLSEYLID